jgi:hypothetical protein
MAQTQLQTPPDLPDYRCLDWLDRRWHLGGRPIHAGYYLEVRREDGTWWDVRIESTDSGRWLRMYFDVPGMRGRQAWIHMHEDDQLRWPKGEG